MKVNIITQPLFSNYGGILQNYALQEVIRQLGHEVRTVNVPVREIKGHPDLRSYARSILNLIAKLKGSYDYPFLNPHTFAIKERELSFPQREFIAKYICKADCKVPFYSEICTKYPADLWIVGSDQVWRPWCSPNIQNYFFDFLDDKTRRIAYAASFGTDRWEISSEITAKIASLAKKFHAISVREQSGVDLCRKHLGVEARNLLDPTMLLDAANYLALTSENDYPHEEYIATYILDNNKSCCSFISAAWDSATRTSCCLTSLRLPRPKPSYEQSHRKKSLVRSSSKMQTASSAQKSCPRTVWLSTLSNNSSSWTHDTRAMSPSTTCSISPTSSRSAW